MRAVADAIVAEPGLAEIYDDLAPDRGLKVIAAGPAAACLAWPAASRSASFRFAGCPVRT
jgi:hypothetical protein